MSDILFKELNQSIIFYSKGFLNGENNMA